MEIITRQARHSDSDGVVRVIKAVFDEYQFTWDPDDYHADLYDLEAHYNAKGHKFFVAELDGIIIGTVALEGFKQIEGPVGGLQMLNGFIRAQGCDCSLERLYVHPDARRCGVGRLLVSHVVELAKAEGYQAMELWSDKRFADAHRLYGKFGAKVVGERICHDPDQSPEWGLVIKL